jgi:uncharacterized protein (DUF305 family)
MTEPTHQGEPHPGTPDAVLSAEETWRVRVRAAVGTAAVLLLGYVLVTGGHVPLNTQSPTPVTDPSVSSQPGGMTMHEMHHGGMTGAPTDEAAYLVDMIPHHVEAIRAAEQLLAGTTRDEMRSFARTIISVQQSEVDTMIDWLRVRHPDTSQVSTYRPMMRDYAALTGDELDRAFLVDMIPHHMTAVMMSRQLVELGLAEHDDVAPFATTIANTQFSEINQMQQWLFKWYGADAYNHMKSVHDSAS